MKIPSPSIPTRLITRAREEKRQKKEKEEERKRNGEFEEYSKPGRTELVLVSYTSFFPLWGRRRRRGEVRQFGFCFRGITSTVETGRRRRGGGGGKEKRATVRGRKARKLCSEQSTMVPLWRGDTLCFSIIFNYFLKAATAFDAHPPSPLLTPPPPLSHPIDPSRFSTSNLKNTTSTTVPPPLHHLRLLPPPPPLCFSLFSVLLSFLPSATGCVTDDRTKRRIREREGRGEKGDLRF